MDQMYTRDLPLLISSLRAPCDNFRVRIIILNPRINLSKGYLFRKYVTQGTLSWFLLLKKKKRELDVINGVQSVTTKRGRRV